MIIITSIKDWENIGRPEKCASNRTFIKYYNQTSVIFSAFDFFRFFTHSRLICCILDAFFGSTLCNILTVLCDSFLMIHTVSELLMHRLNIKHNVENNLENENFPFAVWHIHRDTQISHVVWFISFFYARWNVEDGQR